MSSSSSSSSSTSPIERDIDLTTLTYDELLDRKNRILARLQQLEYKPDHSSSSSSTTTPTVPILPKSIDTHTDYTHKELAWLSADYTSERRRQLSSAKKLSSSLHHHLTALPARKRRERAEFEARLRRLSGRMARSVEAGYWKKIERVVGYKQKLEGEARKRREMDRQLVWMVRQTERYGESLRSCSGGDGVDGGGGMTIEEALRNEDVYACASSRRKRRDYTRMHADVAYESLYGQDEDEENDEEYVPSENEEEMVKEEADYATFLREVESVTREEIRKEVACLMEEGDMELEAVLQRWMEEGARMEGDEEKKVLIEVLVDGTVNEEESGERDDDGTDAQDEDERVRRRRVSFAPIHEESVFDPLHGVTGEIVDGRHDDGHGGLTSNEQPNDNENESKSQDNDSSKAKGGRDAVDDADATPSASNSTSLLDEDDQAEMDEFHPDANDGLDDDTTIEAEEKLGRDMSYADELALLQRESEMSIEKLRALYYPNRGNADNEFAADEQETPERSKKEQEEIAEASSLALLDEDDHEEKDEFHPDANDGLDDETTIEAEEKLGRDMSYADELALLQRESEMSIEELRALYYPNRDNTDNQFAPDEQETPERSKKEEAEIAEASSLALLDEDDHEEKDEFHPDTNEGLDDETTIEAEEKLGRDMSYADELALLQRESEMPIEELRAIYYANTDNNESDSDSAADAMDIDRKVDDDVATDTESAENNSSLALLTHSIDDENDEEDFTIHDTSMELDDETTIEAEEKLGREMTYDEEISQLERENEMSVEELRQLYGLDQTDDESLSEETLTKRKQEDAVDESDDGQPEKRPKVETDEDEGLTAMRSLAATDAKARETMLTRPFLLASWVKLRNYQHIGLNWLVSLQTRRLNGILADEMGLGKTLQTISMLAYLASYKGIWGPHLVIVPTSCLVNWEVEFKRFCPGLKVVCYYGNAKRRKELRYGWTKTNYHHVIITSYQLAVQDSFAFKRKKWYYLILDEAHNIKNFESQRWQTLINFNTQRRLLLTGTPLQNNLMELWSLLHFLMPHVFRNRKDFAYWFSNPMDNIIEGNAKRNDDLINRLHGIIRPFVLRRLKKDVETQLPGKYEHIVKCQLSRRQMFLYEEFMSRSSTRKAMDGGNFMGMMNVLMQLRKVCNHPDLFEPRSVLTPFSMEPLSMSTATCVVNAIEPKSGLDRLSSFVLLPLWSMGHGLPSLEGACSIDDVVANQLSELVTAEPLIVKEARSRQSSEPEPHMDMHSGLASFLSNIRASDQQDRLDKAYFISGVNSWRCQPKAFPFSDRLRSAVALEPLPLDLPLFHEMTASQIAMTPTDLLAMKKSQEQRAEESSELIDKFVFCVPKAGTSSKPVLFAGSSSSSSSALEKELLYKTSEAFRKYLSPFQKANSRLTLCFPDKKLVQFDAGKLQKLANLLRDLKQGGHRVLIFTQMSKMLDVLEAFLNLNGHTYLRLDGATDVDRRQRLMDRFNNDTRIFCFILSTRSGGLGKLLTKFNPLANFSVKLMENSIRDQLDSDWNPAMDAQAQDRAHRIGQTREVHIYRMVTEHSIEENILTKAKQKRNLDFLVMDEGKFHATTVIESNEVTDRAEIDAGFTRGRLKNILGIHSDGIDDVTNTEEDEDLNQDQMQSAMNMLEDEDDVRAMHKAQKEAAEALEEFDESIQFKQDDEEGPDAEDAKAPKSSKVKKSQSTKKGAESDLSAIDLDQSDKADDSSREDEDDKAMELEFTTWQRKIGMDASQINDSLNPLERYGLKIKEVVDPYYSSYYFAEQERLLETAAMSNEWDLDEIEQMKVEEERKAFEDGDLLATLPDPESLPRQRHLYQREKARLRSEIIKRKLTGQNWSSKKDEASGKCFWYNVDTGEAVWEKPLVLKMLDQEATARSNGWSALPSKPLVNIMEFLAPHPDRTKCSSVCKSWKSAAHDISFVLHVWPVEMGALVMDEKKLLKNHFRTIADAVKVALPGDSIELGDGHYWINDPGLEINVPIRFLGDEDDPSHVILELSGEIVWKAKGGWMEGITVRRPKLVTGGTPANEVLRLDEGGRLDIWHCVFDNRGNIGNCVSVAGFEAGGNWERVSIHGGSDGCSGLLVGQSARLQLIDCDISSNAGAGITRTDRSELKLSNCTVNNNRSDSINRSKEEVFSLPREEMHTITGASLKVK
eukprot:CCRYP_008690-RB/>CCRYP_008690-RB protein AED:0.12 eAED:0.19 QI:0/0.90/0.83/1/0.90/0.91/12/164/2166